MGCLEERKGAVGCGACLGITAVLLLIILLPMSFQYIEYYEYGLAQVKATGRVDTSKVYSQGRYFLGPAKTFLTYQADAHIEALDELSVFSAGQSNESIGLEFKIDVDFTYLLIKEEVGELHQELASSYRSVILSRTKDAIKNAAIFVSFTEYFQDRSNVEARFRRAVQARWDTNPSLHAQLDQFHLGRIQIPDSVAEIQLEAKIQNERNDEEAFLQQAKLERELTAVEVNSIQLEKNKLLRTVTAEANLLRATAQVEASQIKAEAQLNGTRLLFDAVGIESQAHMASFTYIRTLANRDSIDLNINYLSDENIVKTMNVRG